MSLTGLGFRLFYEWAAKNRSYARLLQALEKNEAVTHARMMHATSNGFNRSRAAHVIGIERWAANRLRVLLGAPLAMDEYDSYAPGEQSSMEELAAEFKQTRAATKALVCKLQQRGVPLHTKVKHNEAGDLSLAGWLFYIENHTGRETVFLMPRSNDKDRQTAAS